MTGFWAPYDDFGEARLKLCRLADAVGGPGLGVSFSDGRSICVLRHAAAPGGRSLWLNVLTRHIAVPPPPPPAPSSTLGRLKAWFWRAMEIQGEAEIQQAQAQMAASQAMVEEFRDHVWEPTHAFLLRHKLLADTAGILLDGVGVVAAGVFIFVAAPELLAAAAAGSVMAGVGLFTGGVASTGALVLFGVDGTIYGAQITGHEAYARSLEDNSTIGWVRIGATIMLLPDLPVGGMRALKEIGTTASEASEAMARGARADVMTGKATRDLGNVTNPSRHPAEVARQMARVRGYQAEAAAQMRLVEAANTRIRLVMARDVALFPGATAGGAALLAAAPPGVALSAAQRRRDEEHHSSIAPARGWARDVKLEMRVAGYSTHGRG